MCNGKNEMVKDKGDNKGHGINLQIDYAFKYVFGRKGKSEVLLIDLLNAILGLEGSERIVSLQYLDPFNKKAYAKDKLSIMDIKVETEKGETIDIEMQIDFDDSFHKRSLYYWSKMYSSQIESGEDYQELKNVKCINIMSNRAFSNTDELHLDFSIRENDKGFRLMQDLEIHYIQLPNLDDKIKVKEMDKLNEWMTFIRDVHLQEKSEVIQEIVQKESVIGMAFKTYNEMSNDEKARYEYEERMKQVRDINSRIRTATEKGWKEGKEEGREEGKVEFIKQMLNNGKTIKEIVDFIGLPETRVNELVDEINNF